MKKLLITLVLLILFVAPNAWGQCFTTNPTATDTCYVEEGGTGTDCTVGTPCSMTTANTNADAGDIVYLRTTGGNFSTHIEPVNSGTIGFPITFENYATESPIVGHGGTGDGIDGYRSNLAIGSVDYIDITGITFKETTNEYANQRMFKINDANHINITDCLFQTDTLTAGLTMSDHRYFQSNVSDSTYIVFDGVEWDGSSLSTICPDTTAALCGSYQKDLLSAQNVTHSLWINCIFGDASHTPFYAIEGLSGGGFQGNAIINSTFNNQWRRAIAVTTKTTGADLNGWLFEGNLFDDVGNNQDQNPYVPDQDRHIDTKIGTQHTIYRFNIHDESSAHYKPDINSSASNGTKNQYTYHNTWYNQDTPDAAGEVVGGYGVFNECILNGSTNWNYINNIIWGYEGFYKLGTTKPDAGVYVVAGGSGTCNNDDGGVFVTNSTVENNSIARDEGGVESYIQWDTTTGTVAQLDSGHADWSGNWAVDPGFINAAGDNFIPSHTDIVDGARALTTTNGTGSSSDQLIVNDALWFFSGPGSPWLLSDTKTDKIYVDAATPFSVEISSIDYSTDTITLESNQTWENGVDIFICPYNYDTEEYKCFSGTSPDIGAVESGDYYVVQGGSGTACSIASPCALSYANTNAQPGNTVYLMDTGGIFTTRIEPTNSGTSSNLITYESYSTHSPQVSTQDTADANSERVGLLLLGTVTTPKEYIKVKGILFKSINILGTQRLMNLEYAENNIIEDCVFEMGVLTGGLAVGDYQYRLAQVLNSHYNQFINCSWDAAEITPAAVSGSQFDIVGVEASSHNLFKDSTFGSTSHTPLRADTGLASELRQYNAVIGCTFTNNWYRDFEIYTSRTNDDVNGWLISQNLFTGSGWNGENNPHIGDQGRLVSNKLGGLNLIYRFNISDSTSSGITLDSKAGDTQPDQKNWNAGFDDLYLYHNTIYNTILPDNNTTTGGVPFYGDRIQNDSDNWNIINNLVWEYDGLLSGDDWTMRVRETTSSGLEPTDITIEYNVFAKDDGASGTESYFKWYSCNIGDKDYQELNCSSVFANNIEEDPDFADTISFVPQNTNVVDGATHLAVSNGTGTSETEFIVDDANWFFSGNLTPWFLNNTVPDKIYVNATVPFSVELAGIDYSTNTLTLASPQSWNNGAEVYICPYDYDDNEYNCFVGSAPSIGAVESIALTYYIRDDGNDSNTGLSDAQAWTDISTSIPKLNPGDKLLFKCDDTWTEVILLDIDSAGVNTGLDGITISSYYGSGGSEVEGVSGSRPEISVDNDYAINIRGDDIDDLTIKHLWLNVTGAGNDTACVLGFSHLSDDLVMDDIDCDSGGDGFWIVFTNGVTLTNSTINTVDDPTIFYGTLGYPMDEQIQNGLFEGNSAITTGAGGADVYLVHKSDSAGTGTGLYPSANGTTTTMIDTANWGSWAGYDDDDFVGHEIRWYGGSNAGLQVRITGYVASTGTFTFTPAANNPTLTTHNYYLRAMTGDNWIFRNNYAEGGSEDGFDIEADYVLVEYNHIVDCDQNGINFGHSLDNATARFNYIEDSGDDPADIDEKYGCILIGSVGANTTGDIDIYGNICKGTYKNGATVGTDTGTINFYNNTFIQTGSSADLSSAGLFVDGDFEGTSIVWKNNVVYSSHSSINTLMRFRDLDGFGLPGENVETHNNLYYHTSGQTGTWSILGDTDTDTLAEVVSAYSQESGSFFADPLFGDYGETSVDEIALEHYYLQLTSDGIDGGDNTLGVDFDDGIDILSSLPPATVTLIDRDDNTSWDIGAFENEHNVFWVDDTGTETIWNNCASRTEPSGSTSGYCTLATANANISAGQTVYLRTGNYSGASGAGQIDPVNDGLDGSLITFEAYNNEVVTIAGGTGGEGLFNLVGTSGNEREYIKVKDMSFITSLDSTWVRLLRLEYAQYIYIENCIFNFPTFAGSLDETDIRKGWIDDSHYINIINSDFDGSTMRDTENNQKDLLGVSASTHVLILNSHFGSCSHTPFRAEEGVAGPGDQYNAIINTTFDNRWRRAFEISPDQWFINPKRWLLESNHFDRLGWDGANCPWVLDRCREVDNKLNPLYSIMRYNIFDRANKGLGGDCQNNIFYPTEHMYRYHNTEYALEMVDSCSNVGGFSNLGTRTKTTEAYENNVFKNNIFWEWEHPTTPQWGLSVTEVLITDVTTLVNGTEYWITSVGTTDFTAIGAASNSYGTVFTATGPGTGTGQVRETSAASSNNIISYNSFGKTGGTSLLHWDDVFNDDTVGTVAALEAAKSEWITGTNMVEDPGFVDADNVTFARENFAPTNAAIVDGADSLTTVNDSGCGGGDGIGCTGTALVVVDANYFFSGNLSPWFLENTVPDKIYVDNPTSNDFEVVLSSIVYATNTLNLSSSQTWDHGADIYVCPYDYDTLEYTCFSGSAPAIGAVEESSSGDTTAPVISSPLPSGAENCTADPEDILIYVATDETANCKYDTSDTTYALMSNTFSTTNSINHSQTIPLACEDSYLYYVRCADDEATPNVNDTSTQISFSIGILGDTDPPVISGTSPSGFVNCTSDPRNVDISITTDENANCKYNLTNDAYVNMLYTFSTTGTTSHSQTISSLVCDDSYTYYTRCSDGVNHTTSSTIVEFYIGADGETHQIIKGSDFSGGINFP